MRALKKTEKAGVEDPTVRKAKQYGIKSRKMNGVGFRGWPDRLFYSKLFRKGVKGVFIEFKRQGQLDDCTDLQLEIQADLREVGFDVAVFDNPDDAINYLRSFLK